MNVQAGDLAYTVCSYPSDTGLRNSGRIVEVLRFAGGYVYASGRRGINTWVCRVTGSPMHDSNGRPFTGEVFIDDDNLRPIRPDGITTEEVKELFSPSPAKESEKV